MVVSRMIGLQVSLADIGDRLWIVIENYGQNPLHCRDQRYSGKVRFLTHRVLALGFSVYQMSQFLEQEMIIRFNRNLITR